MGPKLLALPVVANANMLTGTNGCQVHIPPQHRNANKVDTCFPLVEFPLIFLCFVW